MGFASKTKSIAQSISLIGGKLNSFAWKTLEYVSKSFPTISFEPSLIYWLMHTYGKQVFILLYPFLKLLAEGKGVLGKAHIPINSKIKPSSFMKQTNPCLHATNVSTGLSHYMLKMTS
jgi:hypothetical protein